MMMSGSSFKSDSTFKYCLVQSTPILNPQFIDTRLFKFESLNPSVLHVVYCVFGFEKSIDRCVWVSHHPTNTQSFRLSLPFSHLDLWNNAALCLPLRKLPDSSTDAVRTTKLPNMESILSSIRALDRLVVFLTNFCRKSCVNESLHCSLDICSADLW